jgi:quinohemoprotein ethanol dehydrogenase
MLSTIGAREIERAQGRTRENRAGASRTMLKRAAPWLAVSLLALAACHAPPPKSTNAAAGQNWTSHNGDPDETSYSQLAKIDASDVGRLGLAWAMDLPGEASLEATPIAVNGVLYFTGSYATVYAVDGVTGKLLWKFDPKTWQHNPLKMHGSFAANRGVAYDNGRIFSTALDGRLFALDAKTGNLIWSTETVPPDTLQTVTGAPRTFKGKVIIGQGGADFGARGYVTAYDEATGKQAWRFYVAPGSPDENKGDPAMEKAAATWHGTWWKTGTGGGPWDSITFDPELNRIYIGTANAGPYDPEMRSPGGGDNLFTASIVALDADTGKYVWHYQVNPRDSWDFDSTQQLTLADLTIDGQPRKVLMQAPKNGFFYVLDRTTGKLISAGKIGKATWADHIDIATGRPVEAKNIRFETGDVTVWPAPTGAHSWQAMAFSPKTGLVYVPTMQYGEHYSRKPSEQKGELTIGGLTMAAVTTDPMDGKGALVAWDPVRQQAAWRAPYDTLWNGGVLATAGDVVFQGAGDGYVYAYDAKTGRQLWKFNAEMGIIAAPMTWSAGGKQYVSVLAGYGGTAGITSDVMNAGWKFSEPRRLLTFALDGKAALPPSPARDKTIHPVDDPKIKLNPADVAAGRAMFLPCAVCHGRDVVSAGGPAPDLRESQIALDPNSFYAVVHDGALIQQGMPPFQNFSRQQVMQLWAYIRQSAREAAGTGQVQNTPVQAKGAAGPM